jgi:predicted transcriptional regulator
MTVLTEKELTIIDRISIAEGSITQRQIAEHAGLSLGLTNIILKKLIKTGYIKVKQLNPKKMQYILTAKGIAEKAQKSYHYVFKTIREIRQINDSIQVLLSNEYQLGTRRIGVLGGNDLAEIMRLFSSGVKGMYIGWYDNNISDEEMKKFDLVLDCREDAEKTSTLNGTRKVRLIDYITKGEVKYAG